MKSRITVITLFLLLISLVISACDAQQPETQEEEGVKTIYVGPQLVDCVGVAPQQCLLVKEDPQAEYTLHYFPIEGFDYEEGYEYELRIREEAIESPPADGSSIKWTLVEEVSKTPAQPSETPLQVEETEKVEEGEMISVYIGPELVECEGVAPQQCMQVKLSPEDDYTLFYDQIEGFEYEPGYEYELRVLVEPVENPPADGSSLRYSLVEEVNRTPVTEEATMPDAIVPEVAMLEGTTWTLLSYRVPNGEPQDVMQGTRISAEFKDGQISGTAGCNTYFGSYESDSNLLTVSPAGSTMKYCAPEELMLQETAYLATLSNVASYEITSGQLHLKNANGETILIFAMEEPTPLTGATWNLLSYNNGNEALVSVIINTEITAVFGEDGALTGSAGCNTYTAGYETDGNNITIGPAASTRKFCSEPEGIMEQESQYLAALPNAAIYQLEGENLDLRDANGSGVASYEAIKLTPEDESTASPEEEPIEATVDATDTQEEPVASTDEGDETTAAATGDDIIVSEELATAVGNASYPIDYTGTGSVQLTDGEFRQPAAEGSAADILTQMTEYVAVGELNNGQQVVAVILISQTGGTGTFYDLAVLAEQDGQLVSLDATYLGDRIIVNTLSIEDGQIVVDMIVQGPEDPFSSPTQQVLQTYELQDGELVLTTNEVMGTVEPQPEDESDIMGVVWAWQELTTPVEQLTIDNPEKYTIEFLPDGLVNVLADCNSGTGTYDMTGDQLSIDITSTTLALCASESHSDLFFRGLNAAALYIVQAEELYIDQFADSGTMRFAKQ